MFRTANKYIVAVAVILSACASQETRQAEHSVFNQQEAAKLTYCTVLTASAQSATIAKQKGMSIDDVKFLFRGQADQSALMAMIDKVYKDDTKNVWEYNIGFFNQCAVQLAAIDAERLKLGSYCNINRMVASAAHEFKYQNKPKQDAYAYFSKFNNKTIYAIVDEVYASNNDQKTVSMNVWGSCMGKVSEK